VVGTFGHVTPSVSRENFCGEWRDKSITPEQERRAELVTQFALAMVKCDDNAVSIRFGSAVVWKLAAEYVDARPLS
jgi:hypothetical protein